MNTVAILDQEAFSERQQEVLKAALDLMVEEGDGFTMRAIANRANCSKETLYKWFGDRDGLLNATVEWQAAKVRIDLSQAGAIDRGRLQASLEQFAENWLSVLSSDISIALNRLAVSHAGTGKSDLGRIVLTRGPFAMAARLKPLMQAGKESGLLSFDNVDEAFRTFFGLVVRDMQIRALLGDDVKPELVNPKQDAKQAVKQFFALYGVGE